MFKHPARKASTANGFTIVEVSLAMGLVLALLVISTQNLAGLIPKSTTRTTFETLVTEIKSQQLKAMSGSSDGGEAVAQGIHFTQDSYTLFKGDAYSATDSANIVVNLENDAQFNSIDLPDSNIIFNQGSGVVSNFDSSQNSFVITTGSQVDQVTVTINAYGVLSWN